MNISKGLNKVEDVMKPNVKFEEVKIIDKNGVWARISDGREITIPTTWFKRLAGASPEKLNKFELTPFGIHWEDLDEDISINAFIFGLRDLSYTLETAVHA